MRAPDFPEDVVQSLTDREHLFRTIHYNVNILVNVHLQACVGIEKVSTAVSYTHLTLPTIYSV